MSKIDELRAKVGKRARVEAGLGGVPKIVVDSELGAGEIYLHGAHVSHFQPRGAEAVLFMSSASVFDGKKPIRGGIPLVFPWFGPRADMPALPPHGFARTREWGIESCDVGADGAVRVALSSQEDAGTLALWPHPFSLRLVVSVGKALDVSFEVKNTSSSSFRFEEALHTYLSVGDISKISVEGLAGADFIDRTDGEKTKKEQAKAIAFTGETDRLYLTSSPKVIMRDPGLRRSIVVEKQNSEATVIWNPWSQKAGAMADMGKDEWQKMVCVETANARSCTVELKAGATHRMSTRISVEGL